MTPLVTCPIVTGDASLITLAHGEGGRLARQLLERTILPCLGCDVRSQSDAAVLPLLNGAPVLTTDSFVVTPLFFPGGDIGSLAVYGTANDLAVAGARPRWLSLSLILEEGLPLETLERVLRSVANAAKQIEVAIVTGDTKVVPRGIADQIFITTTGLGEVIDAIPPGPCAIRADDELIISGPIGRHGIAILSAREKLGFDPPPMSDCGPLIDAAQALLSAKIPVRAMRDATRGGLAAVLHEWAAACDLTLEINDAHIPVTDDVRGACELLGLDPIFIACEGTMVIAVASGFGSAAVETLRAYPETKQAEIIGRATERSLAPVTIQRLFGRLQPLQDPVGVLLPRIC